jgi:hypothetical protein
MRSSLRRRSVGLLLVVTVLLAVGGGIAYATIPNNDGVIHGCWNHLTGQLRVYDPASGPNTLPIACTPAEHALDWNQTGPQGPRHRTEGTQG